MLNHHVGFEEQYNREKECQVPQAGEKFLSQAFLYHISMLSNHDDVCIEEQSEKMPLGGNWYQILNDVIGFVRRN